MNMQSNTSNICIQNRIRPVVNMLRLIDLTDRFSLRSSSFSETALDYFGRPAPL